MISASATSSSMISTRLILVISQFYGELVPT
jgi:hypothetical protein